MKVRFFADHTLPDAFAAVHFTQILADDCCAEVAVQSQGFRGQLAEVYFFQRDVERFAAELHAALAGTGSGDIELESMSPGECALRIRSLVPAGEGVLEASLGHLHLATGEWVWDRTTVSFPLLPRGWGDVLADLDAVLSMIPHDAGTA
jgi:hypothetical protein